MKKYSNVIKTIALIVVTCAFFFGAFYMFSLINTCGNTPESIQLNNFLVGLFGGECFALGVICYIRNIELNTLAAFEEAYAEESAELSNN